MIALTFIHLCPLILVDGVNSLVPEGCGCNFRGVISKYMLWYKFVFKAFKIAHKWMPRDTWDHKLTKRSTLFFFKMIENIHCLYFLWFLIHLLLFIMLYPTTYTMFCTLATAQVVNKQLSSSFCPSVCPWPSSQIPTVGGVLVQDLKHSVGLRFHASTSCIPRYLKLLTIHNIMLCKTEHLPALGNDTNFFLFISWLCHFSAIHFAARWSNNLNI